MSDVGAVAGRAEHSGADDDGPGIELTARLLGAYAAVEGRLYEVLGALAATEAVPDVAVLFDALSQQHAWHAALFAHCRPRLPGDEGVPSLPPAPADALLDAVAELPDSAGRLATLARLLLPRLITGYRRHRVLARPLSDAGVVRALRLVVRDELEAMIAAEALLEPLLGSSDAVAGALGAVTGLETLLAGKGPGLVGGL